MRRPYDRPPPRRGRPPCLPSCYSTQPDTSRVSRLNQTWCPEVSSEIVPDALSSATHQIAEAAARSGFRPPGGTSSALEPPAQRVLRTPQSRCGPSQASASLAFQAGGHNAKSSPARPLRACRQKESQAPCFRMWKPQSPAKKPGFSFSEREIGILPVDLSPFGGVKCSKCKQTPGNSHPSRMAGSFFT